MNAAAESASRQSELIEATVAKTRSLDAERSELEGRVRKMEAQLTDCELAKERSRRDKQTVDNIPKTIFLLFLSPFLSANSAYISLSFISVRHVLGPVRESYADGRDNRGNGHRSSNGIVVGSRRAIGQIGERQVGGQGTEEGGDRIFFHSRANTVHRNSGFASRSETQISLILCLSVCFAFVRAPQIVSIERSPSPCRGASDPSTPFFPP